MGENFGFEPSLGETGRELFDHHLERSVWRRETQRRETVYSGDLCSFLNWNTTANELVELHGSSFSRAISSAREGHAPKP